MGSGCCCGIPPTRKTAMTEGSWDTPGQGEVGLSLLPLSGALMEQISDRGDGSGAQDAKMQILSEACLHQLTVEDSPKDCGGNFTRKSTKNSRPGGGLAGLGFLLLYIQCKNVLD